MNETNTIVKDSSVSTASVVPYEQRKGVTVCYLSRGSVPTHWMSHMTEKVYKRIPSGVYWNSVFAIGSPETGQNYASLRNYCVEESMKRGSKYILFVDDDVFIPETTVGTMLSHMQKGMKIVTGVYYKKSAEIEPVIFKELGSGPYYNYPIHDVFEVEGSGAGCVMIDTEVFDKFREAGLPYFKQDWLMQVKDADGVDGAIQVEIGEDHWLYYQAKKLGYKTFCDSDICCDHYDVKTGKMYPVPEEVYRIKGKGLEMSNPDIKVEIKKMKDNKKKNIMFLNTSAFNFNGNSIFEKPIGGSETAIIQTARRLTEEYNVIVADKCDQEGLFTNVLYMDNSKIDMLREIEIDVCVICRGHDLILDPQLKERIKANKYWLWMQDYPMYPGFDNFLRAEPSFDKLICVSNDHKKALLTKFPCQIDEDKILVFENGVEPTFFLEKEIIKKKKNQFYYSSTPYRGLEILLDVFPKIKEKIPDATLKVCSSLKVYGDPASDKQYENLYKRCKDTEGIEYIGSIKQKELSQIAMESYLMLYPSIFAETNCIAVAEAQTAGTPVICNDLGAIKETVHKGCGVIVPGNPKRSEWKEEYINEVVEVCNNEEAWKQMHEECLKQDFDWDRTVIKWKEELVKCFIEQPTKTVQ